MYIRLYIYKFVYIFIDIYTYLLDLSYSYYVYTYRIDAASWQALDERSPQRHAEQHVTSESGRLSCRIKISDIAQDTCKSCFLFSSICFAYLLVYHRQILNSNSHLRLWEALLTI